MAIPHDWTCICSEICPDLLGLGPGCRMPTTGEAVLSFQGVNLVHAVSKSEIHKIIRFGFHFNFFPLLDFIWTSMCNEISNNI